MSEPLVLVRDEGLVRWLTLNRPRQRNSLSADLITALGEQLAGPGDMRCIAITGAEKAFSAGADLKALQAMRDAGYEDNLADSRQLADLYRQITSHPLPVIAAVNGPALGGGAGLAVACDVVHAARGAVIGFPEVRIGFVPAIVMNFLLRTVGEKVARDLCLTGRRVPVEEAQGLGLVARVVEPAELTQSVSDLAGEIAQASPQAVAETKRLFVELSGLPLAEGLDRAAEANARARQTEECREGIDAFLEKRRPRWMR